MTVKTILVDDSQTVAELTKAICARIGEPQNKRSMLVNRTAPTHIVGKLSRSNVHTFWIVSSQSVSCNNTCWIDMPLTSLPHPSPPTAFLLFPPSPPSPSLSLPSCASLLSPPFPPPPGLQNPEEFSLTSDEETSEQTMRRHGHHARDQKKLDTLKKKLHTDDERMSVCLSVCLSVSLSSYLNLSFYFTPCVFIMSKCV